MAVVYIPQRWPVVPDQAAGKTYVAMRGSLTARQADNTNWAAGWKCRPGAHADVPWQGDIYNVAPVTVNETHRCVFESSPAAVYVACVITYQASRYGESPSDLTALGSGVKIEGTLYDDTTGAALDGTPGVIWQRSDGSLPTGVIANGLDIDGAGYFNPANYTSVEYPALVVSTTIRTDDAPAATPTRPRAFNVGASAGNRLRLDLDTTNVRILHVDVLEYCGDITNP